MGTYPYIADVAIYGFWFAPKNWATCNGGLFKLSQNIALGSLIGRIYGSDKDCVALPNLGDRAPIGFYSGYGGGGLSRFEIGESGGSKEILLSPEHLPAHFHEATFSPLGNGEPAKLEMNEWPADQTVPADGDYLAVRSATADGPATLGFGAYAGSEAFVELGGVEGGETTGRVSVLVDEGSEPVDLVDPYLTLNYCIALTGTFPSRSH